MVWCYMNVYKSVSWKRALNSIDFPWKNKAEDVCVALRNVTQAPASPLGLVPLQLLIASYETPPLGCWRWASHSGDDWQVGGLPGGGTGRSQSELSSVLPEEKWWSTERGKKREKKKKKRNQDFTNNTLLATQGHLKAAFRSKLLCCSMSPTGIMISDMNDELEGSLAI